VTYPNWFAQIAQHNFERFLLPLAGKEWLRFLQLGCFTGDASVWLGKNVLTGEHSWLDDVDTWQGAPNEPIQEQMDFDDVYATYLAKTEGLPITHRRTTTTEYLLDHDVAVMRPSFFDFIYVDAHHTSASAFLDSELSWPLLKSGGILAIDDYEWSCTLMALRYTHQSWAYICSSIATLVSTMNSYATSKLWIRKH
jgi:hypothetical protein